MVQVYGHLVARVAGSNPVDSWKSVSCEFCVLLSGSVHRVGLINRPENSYRMWCDCHHEDSVARRSWSTRGYSAL